MEISFPGFKERDFRSIDGSTWRKSISKLIENRLSNLTNEDFKSRIPHNRRTVYWGSQPFFQDNLMKYAYGAFFIDLDIKQMWIGYKVEKGLEDEEDFREIEPGDNPETVLMTRCPQYWDWLRLKKNIEDDNFISRLSDILAEGYKITVLKDGEENKGIPCTKDAIYFKNKIMEWYVDDEIKGEWLDIFIYKPVPKEEVLRMTSIEVLNMVTNMLIEIKDIYNSCRYRG